jgi:hypothetical protein
LQLKKVQEKADKCRRDVETTKEKYDATLNDLNAYNAKYIEDMSEVCTKYTMCCAAMYLCRGQVYNKSQEWEEKRLHFMKEMLYGIHTCLDLSQNAEYVTLLSLLLSTSPYSPPLRIPQIYQQFRASIDNADASQDLLLWSRNHGTDMPMNWPVFEV